MQVPTDSGYTGTTLEQAVTANTEYGTTPVLLRCYSGATTVLLRCCYGATTVPLRCYYGTATVLLWYCHGTAAVLLRYHYGTAADLNRAVGSRINWNEPATAGSPAAVTFGQ